MQRDDKPEQILTVLPRTANASRGERAVRSDSADAPQGIKERRIAGDAVQYIVAELMNEVYAITELIVPREMREKHEASRRKSQLLGDELRGSGVGELNLGEISNERVPSGQRIRVPKSYALQVYMRDVRGIQVLMELPGPLVVTLVTMEKQDA